MQNKSILLIAASLCISFLAVAQTDRKPQGTDWRVYIGSYTGGKSEGIYLLRLDGKTGAMENIGLAVKVDNPSFLALHPSKPFLYSVGSGKNEAGEQKGMVCAFSINPLNGLLTLLNRQETIGDGPCHVAIAPGGRHVLAANYGSGSIVALPVAEEGALLPASCFIQHEGSSIHPQRQQGPHAHSVGFDIDGKYAFSADLGLDKLMIYRYHENNGKLTAHTQAFAPFAPGAGPRHFAFHPSGRFVYVVNELSNTVTAFLYEAAEGRLTEIQTIGTLPEGYEEENTTAEIRVHPSGKYVYASNRGHDSIAAFAVDQNTGQLISLGQTPTGGKTPRNFNVSPDGKYLIAANQQSDTVAAFRIHETTGMPEATGSMAEVFAPVCVVFFPANLPAH